MRDFSRGLFLVAAPVLLAFFAYQSLSLYTTPVFDSALWYSDESWLMLESRQHVTTGVVSNPIAEGSAISSFKGALLGNVWLFSAIYGAPVKAFPGINPVAVGRTVTLLLSICLMAIAYQLARLAGLSKVRSMVCCFALLSTRCFYLYSHSARYDILVALIILSVSSYSSRLGIMTSRSPILVGAVTSGLSLAVTPHLLILLPLIPLFCLLRVLGSRSQFVKYGLGILLGFLAMFSSYVILTGSWSLFPASKSNQFNQPLNLQPLLHPLSPKVQLALLSYKWQLLREFTGALAYVCLFGVLFGVVRIVRQVRNNTWRTENIEVQVMTLIAVTWWFAYGAYHHYLIHILPVFLILALRGFYQIERNTPRASVLKYAVIILLCIQVFRQLEFVKAASREGEMRTAYSQAASSQIEIECQSKSRTKVLVDFPLINRLLTSESIRPIAPYFRSFPISNLSEQQLLDSLNVAYICECSQPNRTKELTSNPRKSIIQVATPFFDFFDPYQTHHAERDTLWIYERHGDSKL
jgi:hypothetical protein